MKWTKFSEKNPDEKYEVIWMTNFIEKWTRTKHGGNWQNEMKFWADDLQKCAWIGIESPELPKKELHRCEGTAFLCEEEMNGIALYPLHRLELICKDSKRYQIVDFCPFCGYSIKEKE